MVQKKNLLKLCLGCLIMGLLLFPTITCKAAKPVSTDDLYWIYNGKKVDFYKNANTPQKSQWSDEKKVPETFFGYIYDETKQEHVKIKNPGKYVTSRNITVNKNTASDVIKQYGQATKMTYKETEKFHKCLKYDEPGLNTSKWKTYVKYKVKDKKDNYEIRFYFDKNNKVTGITYFKNLNKVSDYPNKELKTGVYFKTPNGKQVTTKTIGGREVYILPKGTKIQFDSSKANCKEYDTTCCIFDEYGECITGTGLGGDIVESRNKKVEWNDNKKISNKASKALKSGNYRYLMLCSYGYGKDKLACEQICYRVE